MLCKVPVAAPDLDDTFFGFARLLVESFPPPVFFLWELLALLAGFFEDFSFCFFRDTLGVCLFCGVGFGGFCGWMKMELYTNSKARET